MIAKVVLSDQILERVVCGLALANASVQKMRSSVNAATKGYSRLKLRMPLSIRDFEM
jgi:hypothetical protein